MERNANAYSELFYHCIQVLNQYTDSISEETFLEEYFQANKVLNFFCIKGNSFLLFKVPNESFVSTILLDCLRHSTLLKTITDIFYSTDGTNVRKSEQNIYKGLRNKFEIFLQ